MQNLLKDVPSEAPLYVRWVPVGGAVAVELRLDLIPAIREAVDQAALAGMEAGGLFLGTMPEPLNPTLRIDAVEMIPRRAEDGAVFMMDPREQDRFLTTRWDSRAKGRTAVGFFRSHLRPGPLRPSLADKSLMTAEGGDSGSVVLLIKPGKQDSAAFFLRSKAGIPEQPSIPEFVFHESQFADLPEVDPSGAKIRKTRGGLRDWLLPFEACAVAAAAVATVPLWIHVGGGGLGLAVNGTNAVEVTWNHDASDLRKARGGEVVFVDGSKRSEVHLTPDDLKFGSVDYGPAGSSVEVTLTVDLPGATSLVQNTTWRRQ